MGLHTRSILAATGAQSELTLPIFNQASSRLLRENIAREWRGIVSWSVNLVADLSRQLWDETPDAVLAVAAGGEVLFWNRAAEAIFGFSSAEAVGRTLADLIVPTDRLEEERTVRENAANRA